jgi:hypothetical protein
VRRHLLFLNTQTMWPLAMESSYTQNAGCAENYYIDKREHDDVYKARQWRYVILARVGTLSTWSYP